MPALLRGRLPFYFGGGNNFVDVRDVAVGHLLAAEKGEPGERYILGGVNRTFTSFFGELARVADRAIFRIRLPGALAGVLAKLNECLARKKNHRSYLTTGQARLLALYFFYDDKKARNELGYLPREFARTVRDTHGFWIRKKAA